MRPLALLALLILPATSGTKLLGQIRDRLGVQVTVAGKDFRHLRAGRYLTGKAPGADQWPPFAKVLVEELAPYSKRFVGKTHLKRIVLCKGLRLSGQLRSAIPDFVRGILYLDCLQNRKSPVFARRVIHHEYFHMVDKIDDGRLFQDNVWKKLNPTEFRYGKGGHTMRDPRVALVASGSPGFLNRYCTSGIAEDKAEMFAFMMVQYKHVETRARTDEVIRKKMDRMKAIAKSFCPDLDGSFWKARRKASR